MLYMKLEIRDLVYDGNLFVKEDNFVLYFPVPHDFGDKFIESIEYSPQQLTNDGVGDGIGRSVNRGNRGGRGGAGDNRGTRDPAAGGDAERGGRGGNGGGAGDGQGDGNRGNGGREGGGDRREGDANGRRGGGNDTDEEEQDDDDEIKTEEEEEEEAPIRSMEVGRETVEESSNTTEDTGDEFKEV